MVRTSHKVSIFLAGKKVPYEERSLVISSGVWPHTMGKIERVLKKLLNIFKLMYACVSIVQYNTIGVDGTVCE